MRTLNKALVAVALVVPVLSASAETVYRWYDSNNTPHFGKRPPEGVKYEVITPHESTAGFSEDTPSAKERAQQDSSEKQDKYSEQLARIERQRKESCTRAKENKERILNNHRIQLRGKDGTVTTLSHEQKMEQLKIMDDAIEEYCD